MQKLFTTLILFVALTTTTNGQKYELAIKGGLIYAPANFSAQRVTFSETTVDPDFGYSASIQAKRILKKHFSWGLEAGFGQYENFISTKMTFTESNNYKVSELGHYEIKQYHIFVFSEYHFGPKDVLLINAGAGICKDYVSQYNSGYRYGFIDPSVPVTSSIIGNSYGRDNPFGLFLGVGWRPKLTNKWRLLADFRYTYLPRSTKGPNSILLSFNPLSLNLGVSYTI